MKGISLHWTVHPEKAAGLYYDEDNQPRSPWYDHEITSKLMSSAAVAKELDISYELSVESIVFREFAKGHILKGKFTPNPHLPVIRFADFGRVNCSVFSQRDNFGRIVFFHEIILTGSDTYEQAKAIEAYSDNLECTEFKDYCDPSGFWADVNTSSISVEILKEHGMNPTANAHQASGTKKKDNRIELMHKKLCERVDGQECLLVHESCRTTIDAFQSGYRYNEDIHGNILDTIKEVHPYEDAIDCVAGTVFEEFSKPQVQGSLVIPIRKKRDKYTGY